MPAVGAILESLPASTRGVVYVEVPDRAEHQAFDTRGLAELHRLVSNGRCHDEALLDAVRAADLPGGVQRAARTVAAGSAS